MYNRMECFLRAYNCLVGNYSIILEECLVLRKISCPFLLVNLLGVNICIISKLWKYLSCIPKLQLFQFFSSSFRNKSFSSSRLAVLDVTCKISRRHYSQIFLGVNSEGLAIICQSSFACQSRAQLIKQKSQFVNRKFRKL